MIENRWLTDDCRNVMRLHFHSRPEFIGTLMEGILALGADGKIIGANRSALEQLGSTSAALRLHTLSTLLGSSVSAMVDRFRSPLATPVPLHLADGRRLHVLARFNWPVWAPLADTGEGQGPTPREAAPGRPQLPEAPPSGAPNSAPNSAPRTAALDALRTGCATADAVIDKLGRVVDRGIPVLLRGDTGTGKVVLARALHDDSSRRTRPFVVLRCAGMDEDLIEAELFGSQATPGQIVRAHGGTLLLDEVGALPLPVQARLLRLLQDGQVLPLGSRQAVDVDVSLVCTTQHTLREFIAAGRFREDLYQRLSGLALRLPPLRERSDLAVLVRRLLDAEPGGRALRLAPEAAAMFQAYPWPGNLRQLHKVLRTACVMAAGGSLITPAHLSDDFLEDAAAHRAAATPAAVTPAAAQAATACAPPRAEAALTLEDLELAAIRRAVDEAGGNISVASRTLGISRNTIYRKLRWRQPG